MSRWAPPPSLRLLKRSNGPIRAGCRVAFVKPEGTGYAIIEGPVLTSSYGERCQHTLTVHDQATGEKVRVKGRNLYPRLLKHVPGPESTMYTEIQVAGHHLPRKPEGRKK